MLPEYEGTPLRIAATTIPAHEDLVKHLLNSNLDSSAQGRTILENAYPGISDKAKEAAAFEAAVCAGVTSHL